MLDLVVPQQHGRVLPAPAALHRVLQHGEKRKSFYDDIAIDITY